MIPAIEAPIAANWGSSKWASMRQAESLATMKTPKKIL